MDSMIQSLQQELVDIAALKSGITWREKGERSARYLKNIHQQRSHQQMITALQPPPSNDHEPHSQQPESRPINDLPTMKSYAQTFYQQLYSIDHVDEQQIDRYLERIRFERQLTPTDQTTLLAPITTEDLITQSSRASIHSSPGSDGLGYPFLKLLFQIPILEQTLLAVYNDALSGVIPQSWQDLRVRLLPKKGDLSSLRNWRPISLINCDAKVFTRILSKRLGDIAGKLLNPYQSGFTPRRFIGDNGLALSMILEQAQGCDHPGIGLLLDQEKAYDRINPGYLSKVLTSFGFPDRFIRCINSIFFGNKVAINVNGFFTAPVKQLRGLRQGDPLSPLLFNFALEPLLLSIIQDDRFTGYSPPHGQLANLTSSPAHIKCPAYADDVCVFLHSPADLTLLQHHLSAYASVSNAKFNEAKTEAIFLNGKKNIEWIPHIQAMHISILHHRGSLHTLRYLGFHIPFTPRQRLAIQEQLLSTIKTQCQLYSSRQLSIMGRVTVANILISSKIWYCLRIFRPTKGFFSTLRSIIYQFIWQKKSPPLAKDLVYASWEKGGLQVLDPQAQHKLLQRRWLQYILQPKDCPSSIYPLMMSHLALMSYSGSFPLLPFYYRQARNGPHISRTLSIWPIILGITPVTKNFRCFYDFLRLFVLYEQRSFTNFTNFYDQLTISLP
jgi:hypothetical protein